MAVSTSQNLVGATSLSSETVCCELQLVPLVCSKDHPITQTIGATLLGQSLASCGFVHKTGGPLTLESIQFQNFVITSPLGDLIFVEGPSLTITE